MLDSLYARYTFDSAANPGNDVSGNGHHGTMNNGAARVIDAGRGGVLELDGLDDHVSVPNMTGSAPELTICSWVNIASLASSYSPIYAVSTWTPGDLHFHIMNAGELQVGINSNTTANKESAYSFSTGGLNTWIHVAAVYSSSAATLQIYINGELDKAVVYTTANDIRLGNAWIGGWSPDPARWFHGRIDDLRLYSRTLSSEEIQRIYLITR